MGDLYEYEPQQGQREYRYYPDSYQQEQEYQPDYPPPLVPPRRQEFCEAQNDYYTPPDVTPPHGYAPDSEDQYYQQYGQLNAQEYDRPQGQQFCSTTVDGQGNNGGLNDSAPQLYFESSRCSGKKKALLIGINYFGSTNELHGCLNDVQNVKSFIIERFGYALSDMVVLTDDTDDTRCYPSRENMISAMQWLVEGAERDDSLFFHFSGHGTQVADVDGDEADGWDEAICPADFQDAGVIIDDDTVHDMLVKPLPAGCRLTAIFDSCHSGSAMDLPYTYSPDGKIMQPNLFAEASQGLLGASKEYARGDREGALRSIMAFAKTAMHENQAERVTRQTKTAPADVIEWAGCNDAQTSADTRQAGKATGAMSYAFINALTRNPRQSYQLLLYSLRDEMSAQYTQKPQLSACHPIDTAIEFVA